MPQPMSFMCCGEPLDPQGGLRQVAKYTIGWLPGDGIGDRGPARRREWCSTAGLRRRLPRG